MLLIAFVSQNYQLNLHLKLKGAFELELATQSEHRKPLINWNAGACACD